MTNSLDSVSEVLTSSLHSLTLSLSLSLSLVIEEQEQNKQFRLQIEQLVSVHNLHMLINANFMYTGGHLPVISFHFSLSLIATRNNGTTEGRGCHAE